MLQDDLDNELNYWLTRPEEIRAALFELTHPDSHILVRDPADRELAVTILALDKDTSSFAWAPRDYAGADFAQNERSLLAGGVFDVVAQGYSGVQIRFRIPRPEIIRLDDGRPALLSPFPERLARIQRRRAFRAQASPASISQATARWSNEEDRGSVEFRIRDISVDGIGLRSESALNALPEPGAVMEDVVIDFGQAGSLNTSLQVRNTYALGRQDPAGAPDQPAAPSKPAPAAGDAPISHVGASFVDLNARQENWLQQIVWRLEKHRGNK